MPDREVVAIVNPLSGTGADPAAVRARLALLETRFTAAAIPHRVFVTEGPHHARQLAAEAVTGGVPLVVAWGGDGTINEVGTSLSGTSTTLAIIPAGSGNGFAAELGVPRDPGAALEVALTGATRRIDVGDLNGRRFFNIAGIGFDASVARRFNERPMGRRGLGPYVRIGLGEAFRYRSVRYTVTLGSETLETAALLIAFANGSEYGNGLRLAPHARLDDGQLEAMVVAERGPLARLWSGRHLALGTAERAAGITLRSVTRATVESRGEMLFHVDGEVGVASGRIDVRLHPGSLKVRIAERG